MRKFLSVAAPILALVLAALLCSAGVKAADGVKPIKVLLVIGGCCHDYAAQKEILAKGLAARAHVEVTIAYDPDKTTKHLNPVYEKADWAAGFDVVIHDECSSDVKDKAVIDRILAPHRAGLPGVLLHCGMHSYRSEGYPGVTPWFEFTGLQSTGHGPQAPIDISFLKTDHAITKGHADWTTINEELYNNSAGKLWTRPRPWPAASKRPAAKRARQQPATMSSPGSTTTTAPRSSPPRSATTTRPSPTPATSTSSPAASFGPAASCSRSI